MFDFNAFLFIGLQF